MTGACLVLAGLVTPLRRWWLSRSPVSGVASHLVVVTASLAATVGANGCQKPAGLQFEEVEKDLGFVFLGPSEKQLLKHAFSFEVRHPHIVIDTIEKNCSCLLGGWDLFGEELQVGKQYEMPVTLRLDGTKPGRAGGEVIVVANPTAATVRLRLSAIVRSKPAIVPGSLKKRLLPSEQLPSDFQFIASFVRLESEPTLSLDVDRSNFGPFELASVEPTSTIQESAWDYDGKRVVRDSTKIVLAIPTWPSDTSIPPPVDTFMSFSWNEGQFATKVPCVLERKGLIEMPSKSLYIDGLQPEERKKIDLPLVNNWGDGLKCDVQRNKVVVDAKVTDDKVALVLAVPKETGEFATDVVLNVSARNEDSNLAESHTASIRGNVVRSHESR